MMDLTGGKPIVIAEVAQAHDGSLGMAHSFIDAIADAGADAVKFQTHIAEAESTLGEPWRVRFSQQDETRYDYWCRMEFAEEQWMGLRAHAEDRGLLFLSSPFSPEAVELLKRVGVAAWKVASGEVTNAPLFELIGKTGLPVLLSTGMSTIAEIDEAVARLRALGSPFAVLQCTSMYPTPPERIGLNLIPFFRERYACSVGISDHSGALYPCLGAAALGASVFEVHVTFHSKMFGPDVPASVTFEELASLVESIRFITKACESPVDKDAVATELAEMRRLFTKSIVPRRDLPAGTDLLREDLALKKTGGGIPASHLEVLIGRRLRRALAKDEPIREGDWE